MADFSNQVAFITGAGSGIGRATALAFAQAGARVVVADLNETNGQQTVAEITQTGREARFISCDVACPDDVEKAVQYTVGQFGRLDIGINNAGIGGAYARLVDQTFEDWNRMLAVNLSGVFYCMQFEIRQMLLQGGGKIVNLSSIAGVRGLVKAAPYTAAKHGVLGLTKTAALEYVKHNIRVNAVCPVYTHSAMVDELINSSPDMENRLRRAIPIGRFGQPEEIAQAILWLCSDENAFCTGQAIQMDGGLTAG
ncbi:SDR family NAD(P)-dependent oxidoreductase [Larkinella terrae]|uniref:Glucose 1-dehydrogenase n=1 Tax=Larkinella terrae TaxID=2025311 RepID=A0A7K0EI40_9BACT|nr:glucose 1-dehydrogenase [Larkinella terrae]MRS61136.1 glucose 1-dehydrogenase [Larkinella terrae]